MKKIIVAITGIILLASMAASNDKGVNVNAKSINLPAWQWNSGNISFEKTTVKPCFALVFSHSIYHPGDSVKITFACFKVILANLNKGATFEKWIGKIRLVYYKDKKWVSLIKDTARLINHPFSGKGNNRVDSIANCSIMLTIPSNMSYTIAADMQGIEMHGADGHGKPINAAGGQMLSVSIKGIEVEKIAMGK